jgi:hypothetical protein
MSLGLAAALIGPIWEWETILQRTDRGRRLPLLFGYIVPELPRALALAGKPGTSFRNGLFLHREIAEPLCRVNRHLLGERGRRETGEGLARARSRSTAETSRPAVSGGSRVGENGLRVSPICGLFSRVLGTFIPARRFGTRPPGVTRGNGWGRFRTGMGRYSDTRWLGRGDTPAMIGRLDSFLGTHCWLRRMLDDLNVPDSFVLQIHEKHLAFLAPASARRSPAATPRTGICRLAPAPPTRSSGAERESRVGDWFAGRPADRMGGVECCSKASGEWKSPVAALAGARELPPRFALPATHCLQASGGS